MSKKRKTKGGWVRIENLPKSVYGRTLCRFCRKEVFPPKRTFCSAECVHQHKIRSQPSYMRKCVFKRDKGICAYCGCDTMKLQRVLAHTRNKCGDTLIFAEILKIFGISNYRGFRISLRGRKGHLWDADHIISVIEGGGECGLENIQTLCIPCHNAKTLILKRKKKS